MKSLSGKLGITKVIILIVILCVNFSNDVLGNDSRKIIDFPKRLQELRDLNSVLSDQISRLRLIPLDNQKVVEKLGLLFLLTKISEINTLSLLYIVQLNEYDPSLEIRKRTGEKALEIPEKSTNYCCWNSLSLIHGLIRYNVQETLNDQTIKNINDLSPNILHSIRDTLEKLQASLKYFDGYFAVYKQ